MTLRWLVGTLVLIEGCGLWQVRLGDSEESVDTDPDADIGCIDVEICPEDYPVENSLDLDAIARCEVIDGHLQVEDQAWRVVAAAEQEIPFGVESLPVQPAHDVRRPAGDLARGLGRLEPAMLVSGVEDPDLHLVGVGVGVGVRLLGVVCVDRAAAGEGEGELGGGRAEQHRVSLLDCAPARAVPST